MRNHTGKPSRRNRGAARSGGEVVMYFKQHNLGNFQEKTASEISIYYAGWQKCPPSHRGGCGIRDHYLMHYIVGGHGEFRQGNVTRRLGPGDGFLICPSVCSSYKSDPADPWEYFWIGFYGPGAKALLESADLSVAHPAFHYDRDNAVVDCLQSIVRSTSTSASVEYEALGYFYLMMSRLIEEYMTGSQSKGAASSDYYVEKAKEYIQCNYSRSLSVQEIASYVGLDRSQLFRLFKISTDYSPQQYLIHYRTAKACELIANTDLNFEEIAHSVGFEYSSYFFRQFKKRAGLTPSEYRQNILEMRAGERTGS